MKRPFILLATTCTICTSALGEALDGGPRRQYRQVGNSQQQQQQQQQQEQQQDGNSAEQVDVNTPQERRLDDEPLWYPAWSSGQNTCMLDCPPSSSPPSATEECTPKPSYMSHTQNLMRLTKQKCCDDYYWWDLETCLGDELLAQLEQLNGDVSNEPAYDGTYDWYPDFTSFKCVQDCDSTVANSTYQCGGIISNETSVGTELYSTSTSCCSNNLSYLALGLCVASSENLGTYGGSGGYYVDYIRGRCVQDCDPTSPNTNSGNGICGGIITESSTKLYTNTTSCCATELSYLDPHLCETRSTLGGVEEGTFRLYPNSADGSCVIDHNPANLIVCSIGYTCRLLSTSSYISKLYPVSPAGVEECCGDLGYVNPTYCKSKTMGVVSKMWFVVYGDERCYQDCEDDSNEPSCKLNADPAAIYYESHTSCCTNQLGFLNQPKCHADSTGTLYEGSNGYYVSYKESKCVQDCPLSKGGDCGGVLEDSSTALYGDAGKCCSKSLGYMNSELCRDRSDSSSSGTGKYYLDEDELVCVKDTSDPAACPTGETCQRVDGWVSNLYGTITKCCKSDAALSVMTRDYCQARSSGTTSEKWFLHDDTNRCAKHCPTDNASTFSPECGNPSKPTLVQYNNVEKCCTTELDYLNVDSCVELSEKGGILADLVGTDEYYVDWVHQKCVKNCPEGNADSSCGGIVLGKHLDLYEDVDDCCKVLHYIERDECHN